MGKWDHGPSMSVAEPTLSRLIADIRRADTTVPVQED